MRWLVAAMGALLLTSPAWAQTAETEPAEPERGTIGLPLPRIGLPHPPMGLPPVVPAGPQTKRAKVPPAPDQGEKDRRRALVYVMPMIVGSGVTASSAGAPARPPAVTTPSASPARVRFTIEPRVALHLYADGYYVGGSEDGSGEVELESGARALEFRGDGYETLRVPMRIEAGRSVEYRGRLTPAQAVSTAAPAAGVEGTRTFYVIPRCYMGDVPPDDARLPATCDPRKVITIVR